MHMVFSNKLVIGFWICLAALILTGIYLFIFGYGIYSGIREKPLTTAIIFGVSLVISAIVYEIISNSSKKKEE